MSGFSVGTPCIERERRRALRDRVRSHGTQRRSANVATSRHRSQPSRRSFPLRRARRGVPVTVGKRPEFPKRGQPQFSEAFGLDDSIAQGGHLTSARLFKRIDCAGEKLTIAPGSGSRIRRPSAGLLFLDAEHHRKSLRARPSSLFLRHLVRPLRRLRRPPGEFRCLFRTSICSLPAGVSFSEVG